MRLHLLIFACAIACASAACYSGSTAARDVNLAWRGHARVEIEARIGVPRVVLPQPDGRTVLRWIGKGTHYELPSGSFDLKLTPTSLDVRAEGSTGTVERYEFERATALIDPAGTVVSLDSRWMVAGIPAGMNLRTGVIFGLHGGMGALNDATSPMPSVGIYLGGMLGPRHALVGAYALVHGKDDAGYAQGHSWALALQYWPAARLNVRAGPAMVLDLAPGFEDAGLSPGAVGAASYGLVRVGSFVLDARFDATVSTATAFGMFGIGVNVN